MEKATRQLVSLNVGFYRYNQYIYENDLSVFMKKNKYIYAQELI